MWPWPVGPPPVGAWLALNEEGAPGLAVLTRPRQCGGFNRQWHITGSELPRGCDKLQTSVCHWVDAAPDLVSVTPTCFVCNARVLSTSLTQLEDQSPMLAARIASSGVGQEASGSRFLWQSCVHISRGLKPPQAN